MERKGGFDVKTKKKEYIQENLNYLRMINYIQMKNSKIGVRQNTFTWNTLTSMIYTNQTKIYYF